MKQLVFLILLLLGIFDGFNRIAKTNRLKNEAQKAFLNQEYDVAVARYTYLIDSMKIGDEAMLINLANAMYRNDSINKAGERYNQVLSIATNKVIIGAAQNQSGYILAREQKYDEAIQHFEDALRADPDNEEARYNYELLMKWNMQNKQNQQNDQDQPEPSDFAKRLKEKAEQLAGEGRFLEAYNLMQQGLKIDVTVGAYQEFINKLGDVAEIDEKY